MIEYTRMQKVYEEGAVSSRIKLFQQKKNTAFKFKPAVIYALSGNFPRHLIMSARNLFFNRDPNQLHAEITPPKEMTTCLPINNARFEL